MTERMTWSEIKQRYPDQWVGLTDVEHEPDNDSTIKSAVVAYTDWSKDDLILEQIQTNGRLIARYTNPNALFQLGVLG